MYSNVYYYNFIRSYSSCRARWKLQNFALETTEYRALETTEFRPFVLVTGEHLSDKIAWRWVQQHAQSVPMP